ncbi:MAG TPA: hypothetical protein VLS27_07550 [Gammaproteobacteria bacterium]|nr:hypothetical protein [Gammaproteobacteria bacterium]
MIDPVKPVRVFKNWKLGCYSIAQDGRLKASARQVRLADVEFRVRQSGRRRMLEKGVRNVHAYAIGRLIDFVHPEETRQLERMSGRATFYDPMRFAAFVDSETKVPVIYAGAAYFDERGVIYDGPSSGPTLTQAA